MIEKIEDALSYLNDFDSSGSHGDMEVSAAEQALGVTLSEDFKEYLRKWGNLAFDDIELYGLTKNPDFKNSSVPNFIWFTLRKREQVGLPHGLVVFQNVNDTEYYCLNTAENINENSCEVVVWDNINREIERTLPISFHEYLLEIISEL